MKKKLIKILGLKPAIGQKQVTEDQILNLVNQNHCACADAQLKREQESQITDLVKQSCGALSRDDAREVLATRSARSKMLGE